MGNSNSEEKAPDQAQAAAPAAAAAAPAAPAAAAAPAAPAAAAAPAASAAPKPEETKTEPKPAPEPSKAAPDPTALASSIAAPQASTESPAKPSEKSSGAEKGAASKAKAKAKAKGEAKKSGGVQRLSVQNLDKDITQEQLEAECKHFGTLKKCVLTKVVEGKPRMAFLTFSSMDEAKAAQTAMDKKTIAGQEITVAFEAKREQSGEGDSKGGKGKSKGKGKDAPEKGKGKGKGKQGDEKGKGKGKGKKGAATPGSPTAVATPQQAAYPYAQQGYAQAGYPYDYTQYAAQMQYYAQMQSAYMAQVSAQMQAAAVAAATPTAASAPAAAVGFGQLSDQNQEHEGTLKSLSAKNGYGFIAWPANATNKWYVMKDSGKPRDVYVDTELLPEEGKVIGAKLKFTVAQNAKGHPQAKTCKLG